MKKIYTKNAPEPIGPYSQGYEHNNTFYFSGQIALNEKGEFINESLEAEIKQVLKNISALLSKSNLTKENVIKTTIYLSNINDFNIVNKFYGDFFQNHAPARSTVEVSRLPKNAKVEIEIIAVK